MSSDPSTRQRIKEILVESLNLETVTPEEIGDDMPLWGEGLGLDSVDALELMVALEQEYGFKIDSEQIEEGSLSTVARLEDFVEQLKAEHAAEAASPA